MCARQRRGGPSHHSATSKIFSPFRQQPAQMINLACRTAEPGSAKSIWGENFSKKGLSFLPPPCRFACDFTAWQRFGGSQLFLQRPGRETPPAKRERKIFGRLPCHNLIARTEKRRTGRSRVIRRHQERRLMSREPWAALPEFSRCCWAAAPRRDRCSKLLWPETCWGLHLAAKIFCPVKVQAEEMLFNGQ